MAGNKDGFEPPSAPGWYPDPFSADGRGERYFDGKKWGTTERPLGRHTATATLEARPRATSRSRRVTGLIILAGLVVVAVWVLPKFNSHDRGTAASSPPPTSPAAIASQRPPAGHEEAASPLGKPASVPVGDEKFEVLEHQTSGSSLPVAWDPCRPIHYVVNRAGEPKDGAALIRDAITRVSKATGLHFVDDGATRELPDKDRLSYQPKAYGADRWAPLLIAWSDEKRYPELAGYIDGIGSPHSVYAPSGGIVYVSGQLVLDRSDLAAFSDRRQVRATILHELGHVVGLDHTSDRRQLMFSEGQRDVSDFGIGDQRGLALLGTQDCFPDV